MSTTDVERTTLADWRKQPDGSWSPVRVNAGGKSGGGSDDGTPGPPGPPGATGPAGPQGEPGPAGAPSTVPGPIGPKGDKGDKGGKGDTGNTGATGAKGDPGQNGEKWWTGAGAPAAGLGATGDLYLNTTNGDVYDKATGAWVLAGNIKGVKGDTGAQGPIGNTGATGATGAPGAAGEKWWTAAGPPTAGTGANGDLALNTVNGDIYEKQSGAWVKIGNIQGPPGGSATDSNALLNPSFENWTGAGSSTDPHKPDGDLYNWSLFWGSVGTRGPTSKGTGRDVTSAHYVGVAGTDTNQVLLSDDLVVLPGQLWYVSIYVKSDSAANPITFDSQLLSAATPNPQPFGSGVHLSPLTNPTAIASTTYTLYEAQVTVPAGDLYAKVLLRLTASGANQTAAGDVDLAVAKNLTPPAGSLAAYPSWAQLDGVATGVPAPGSTPVFALPYPGQVTKPDGPTQIKALADALEAALVSITPTAWTNLTFQNGWSNYSGSFQSAQYRKVGDVVEMRGVVKGTTWGTAICTLPAGFRPPASLLLNGIFNSFNTAWNTGAASAGTAHTHANTGPSNIAGRITVAADGTITPVAALDNGYLDLSDIRFSVLP